MARKFRVVAEGLAHHVIQRGNRRQKVFFSEEDKRIYLSLLKKYCDQHGVLIWAYCLMDNHVHLVLVPSRAESLAQAVGQAHWWYTTIVNKRQGWKGYLWQGRFNSFVLHNNYLRSVVRYVELNPVRAGMVEHAERFPWSSARAHIERLDDPILDHLPLLDEIQDWKQYLQGEVRPDDLKLFRRHLSTGKPLGDKSFIEELSGKLGVDLTPQKPGPKPKKS